MRVSSLLVLVGAALSSTAVASIDAFYDDAVYRSFLPSDYMLNKLIAMGFESNTTVQNDDGTVDEIWGFDLDTHDALQQNMLAEVLAAGPNNGTDSSLDMAVPQSDGLVARQQGSSDSFSCKAANTYVYNYALNSAASLVCGSIFTVVPDKAVTYTRTRYLNDYRSRQVEVIWKYTWLVPGFATANACSTLMTRIVTDACNQQVTGDKGTNPASQGGSDEVIKANTPQADADISISR